MTIYGHRSTCSSSSSSHVIAVGFKRDITQSRSNITQSRSNIVQYLANTAQYRVNITRFRANIIQSRANIAQSSCYFIVSQLEISVELEFFYPTINEASNAIYGISI